VGVRHAHLDVLAVFLDVGFLLEDTAVFQSQVGGQLIALARCGYAAGVLAVVRDEKVFERVIGERLRAAGVAVWRVRAGSFAAQLVRMAGALRQLVRERPVRHAYVRGLWGPVVIALSRTRIPYLYDVRGSLADEMLATGTPALKRHFYLTLERWCIRRAANVSAVTGVLAGRLRETHRRGASMVPCCVDAGAMIVPRDVGRARRAELGYGNEVVLVYSGGLSHYQQVPAMLALWRRLLVEPEVRFLLLTNEDPHKSPQTVGDLADFGERLRHLSLPHAQVAATLAAADIGFMLRDARELNRVASPVKFPEYLCAGLAVVGSPHTGDASALIESAGVGTLVDPGNVEEGVVRVRALIARCRTERDALRARGQKLVRAHYDWQSYAETFRANYGAPGAAGS
jgi:glycosyltransferase involved in cell wall biosynthesis